MYKDEVFIHLQFVSLVLLEDNNVKALIINVVWGVMVPSQVLNPLLNPLLVYQVQQICIFFILLKLVVRFQLHFPFLLLLKVYYC